MQKTSIFGGYIKSSISIWGAHMLDNAYVR